MATPTVNRVPSDPDMVRRQNQVFDLYNTWPSDDDPDDDPEFVRRSRELMGEPPLPERLS